MLDRTIAPVERNPSSYNATGVRTITLNSTGVVWPELSINRLKIME